jgi:hypothetical protein
MLKPQDELRSHASCIKACTAVVPIGNIEPDAYGNVSTCSMKKAEFNPRLKFTTAPLHDVELTVISAGQVICGGGGSFTVTLNVQVDVGPQASIAVAVIVVVPKGKRLPD